MKREEHLKFCRICKEQKIDKKQGIICGITNLPADFEISCESFNEDLVRKNLYELQLWEKEIQRKTAKIGKRITNFILDLIFIYLLGCIFGIILGIFLFFVSPESLDSFSDGSPLTYLLGTVLYLLYYSLFEGLSGRTLAKFITRTKVVDQEGEKPDFKKTLIRTITRLVPFEWISFMGEGTGWHDTWSKTIVVENRLGKRKKIA